MIKSEETPPVVGMGRWKHQVRGAVQAVRGGGVVVGAEQPHAEAAHVRQQGPSQQPARATRAGHDSRPLLPLPP
eukprot:6414529-Pyramimonas_sp.AAC.1